MNIEDLTLRQIKELQGLLGDKESFNPFAVGKNYLIRTVTHFYTGKIKEVGSSELVLSECSWIADTGRFHDAVKSGELSEVEPFVGDVIIGRGAIIDATEWTHALPREQK